MLHKKNVEQKFAEKLSGEKLALKSDESGDRSGGAFAKIRRRFLAASRIRAVTNQLRMRGMQVRIASDPTQSLKEAEKCMDHSWTCA